MSPRRKLDELTEERLIRVGTRQSLPDNMKLDYQKEYFVQTNWDIVFAMFVKLSGTARLIAAMMIKDVNHFTNIYSGTYEEVQEEVGMSDKPVKEAMVELQQVDFIRKYRNGRYMINPAVGIGCSKDYLPKLLDKFHSLQSYTSRKKLGGEPDVDRQSS